MIGELLSDGAKLHSVLSLMILCLPLAIWFFRVLIGLGVSDWSQPYWKQVELCDLCKSRSLSRQAVLSLVMVGLLRF